LRCSICIATYSKPKALAKTLDTIFVQQPGFEFEVIVVDDGSPEHYTGEVCATFPVKYTRIEREPLYRNPSVARNLAYKQAQGEVIICQSDDVYHDYNSIQGLVDDLEFGTFVIATVWNVNDSGKAVPPAPFSSRFSQLTGPQTPRPLFFLGCLFRKDLYAVGGNDEEFTRPGREDVWFADCLINGLGLSPKYSDVRGFHQDHLRPPLASDYSLSKKLYHQKRTEALKSGVWRASKSALWQANKRPV